MRTIHLPRYVFISFLILLGIAFLGGNILVFSSVKAATLSATPPVPPTATGTLLATISPTPTLPPYPDSADTTGILIFGILLVSVILIGLVWGNRIPRKG